ncbi:polysaccharide biosynthesis protein [Halobiforma lacisalsi AJ5]|uniref:Polysaccharide biosynthesis protein n=1 Tax=Natronobacterium lacisalsi AJ5 TaxID=358396 RepID=M0L470_NATLA|nr:flippase [Halobiforma lacisalsi]APW98879.1 polysaccharide biosynthesis protein [Halobiforma lacisalsi AJ5]EMA27234.1 polysaccharide biosynthesis protein [Halobiforma lacisalsi AJ5]
MRTNVLRGFISILGAKVTVLLIGLLTTPILVRLLGSAQYGDYAFLLSVLGVTMVLANAGIFDGMRKYIAEERDHPNWTEYVFGFYLRIAFGLAIFVSIIYAVFSWAGFSKQLFSPEFTVYFYLLSSLIIIRQTYSLARGGLMGLGFENQSEPLNILRKVIFALIGLSLTYFGHGVVGILTGHVIASLTVSFLAFRILSNRINLRKIFDKTPPDFPKQELLSFNGLSVILILLTSSLYHIDILLLRPLAGSEATGYYRAALTIAEFLWFVPNALQMVLLHSTSELWAKGRTDRITMMVSQITRHNLSLVILLAIGLAVLADDFVPFYFGSEFEPVVLPLLLLLPGVIGFSLARPIFAVGQGKGELPILIVATGTAALVNLCLNILLIPRYEMVGAAIATSIGYGSMMILHIYAARQIGYNPIADLRFWRITTVAMIAGVVIFGVSSVIDSSLLSLLIVPPIGFMVYATLMIKFEIIHKSEVNKIIQQLPNSIEKYITTLVEIAR